MKKPVIILVLVVCSTNIYAQNTDHRSHYNTIDSLEQILQTDPPTGTDLLVVYRNLAWGSLGNDHEKVRYYSLKGISLAQQLDIPKVESFFHQWLGLTYYHESRYDSALLCYDKALEATERMRTSIGPSGNPYLLTDIDNRLASINGDIGNLYNIQGKYHQAVEYYMKALEIFEKHGWKEMIFNVYGNIGEMYLGMDNLEQAEENALKADIIAYETMDSIRIATSKEGLSKIYLQKRDYGKALQSALIAHGYYFAHPEQGSQISVLNTLGIIYLDGYNDEKETEKYVRQALEAVDIMNLPREKAISLRLLTAIHMKRDQWQKAEQAALEALAVDDTEPVNTMVLYRYLSKIYAHFGNADKSGEYFDKLTALQSSWSNKNYQSAIRDMEVKYETEKKETRIAALEDEKRLMIWLGVAVIFSLILLAIALLFRQKNQSNQRKLADERVKRLEEQQKLAVAEAELDGEAAERSRIARDLHDGLGGMLAAVKINMQNAKPEITAEMNTYYVAAFDILDDSMKELRRIAHHLMPESLVRCGLKTSLEVFCQSIPDTRFHYFGEDVRIDGKLEVLLYRSAYELIYNVIKHAEATRTNVQLIQESERISLTVQDNGKGFDPSQESRGMGLSNIRQRAAVFNGEFNITSEPGNGTEVNLEFHIKPNMR